MTFTVPSSSGERVLFTRHVLRLFHEVLIMYSDSNVVLMLVARLRRWPNIKTTLDRCLMYTGYIEYSVQPASVLTNSVSVVHKTHVRWKPYSLADQRRTCVGSLMDRHRQRCPRVNKPSCSLSIWAGP